MASTLNGPLGVGVNKPVIDKGTSARIATPTPAASGSEPPTQNKAALQSGNNRLDEIRRLVQTNNLSTLDENVIICQIYMESRFDARAGAGHNAKGLMQVQLNAVQQVYKYRKQKEIEHTPSDKMTAELFSEAKKFHKSAKMMDEATNIQIGTEYMQYWLDNTDTVDEAYKKYRGKSNGVYYRKIKAAADKLSKNPQSMQILLDMVQ
ncbi:MAG: transglycosylase SLT domain-containing protein [Methylococcales bacterium]|nr:transglycosylase SLT domain-containing protein [Methylococcales bacterium]